MFTFLNSISESVSAFLSSIFGAGSPIGKLLAPILSLTAGLTTNQIDTAIVILAVSVFPLLGIMANTSWGKGTFRKIYGEIEGIELRKFLILAFAFGLVIGAYWSMRVLKDGVFNELVGIDFIPRAKILSVFVLSAVIFIFSNIVDYFKKHHLFFLVCSVYSVIFLAIAFMDWMQLPEITAYPFNLIPGRAIGWVYYLAVESLGGILVGAVFWAFVVSTTTTTLAKRGFPIIYIGGQIGNLVGTTLVKMFVHKIGHPLTIVATTVPLLVLPLVIELLVLTTPKDLMVCDQGHSADGVKTAKPSMIEGLKLIVTRPYLLGVAVVSTIYEVVGTIVDFQFKKTASAVYSKEMLSSYLASFGQALSILSLLFAILGTSFFVRRFGVRVCLFGYPLVIAACIVAIMIKPEITVFFVAMMAVKAFSYTLNSPIKELLYLPTSKDVKYKAKGFIDGLGGKASKAAGSAITDIIRTVSGGSRMALVNFGGMVSLGIVGFWIAVAYVLGNTYHSLVKKNEIIK